MGERSGSRRVLRLRAGAGEGAAAEARWAPDVVAAEEPLSIVVAGDVVATTMRTPGDDIDLVLGWLVAEGVVRRPGDVAEVRCPNPQTVQVRLAEGVSSPAPRLGLTSSACGVCGTEHIDEVCARIPRLPETPGFVDPHVVMSLPARLRDLQPLFDRTGGLHAAAWFTPDGESLLVREDVGRHNAVDKVVGALLRRDRLPAGPGVLQLSGRASYELVLKAAMAGFPVVSAVSAPSTAAVDLARAAGLTLLGFVRDDRANVYAGEQRLALGSGEEPSGLRVVS